MKVEIFVSIILLILATISFISLKNSKNINNITIANKKTNTKAQIICPEFLTQTPISKTLSDTLKYGQLYVSKENTLVTNSGSDPCKNAKIKMHSFEMVDENILNEWEVKID